MLQSKARLLELNAKLAETLTSKGVTATADETTTALVNKVAYIKTGDNADLVNTLIGIVEDSITDLIIPDGATKIAAYIFHVQTNLITVTLPATVLKIDTRAFQACTNLTTVNLANGITNIEYRTFYGCTNLKKINLPNSLITVNGDAFLGCTNLVDVTLDDGFNCSITLSSSTLYSRDTILQWLNAIADRTGQTAYKLTIGAKNLAKLTEEDVLIATNKNWTLA